MNKWCRRLSKWCVNPRVSKMSSVYSDSLFTDKVIHLSGCLAATNFTKMYNSATAHWGKWFWSALNSCNFRKLEHRESLNALFLKLCLIRAELRWVMIVGRPDCFERLLGAHTMGGFVNYSIMDIF
jgi:hypothetical protein